MDTSTYQGYLPPGEGWMEILRMEGEEVWTEDGTRTLDDQSVLQVGAAGGAPPVHLRALWPGCRSCCHQG